MLIRSAVGHQCNGEMHPDHSSSLINITSSTARDHPLPSPVSQQQLPYHHPYQPTTSSSANSWTTHRAISSSTSDMQSAADPRVVSPHYSQQVPAATTTPHIQSLTRGSTRLGGTEEGLGQPGVSGSSSGPGASPMASSMPSIPRECNGAPAGSETVAINTRGWDDSLRRRNINNVHSMSRSTDQMVAASSAMGAAGHEWSTPSRSTLVGSSVESFTSANAATSSQQSLDSTNSGGSAASKKRRVRFELQPTSAATRQRDPDPQRQRARSRSDRQRRTTVGDQAPSGSLFSKFRRVVVDGVGSLLGLSKKNVDDDDDSVENCSQAPVPGHPLQTAAACNGGHHYSSFEDMTEMERLATVADRIASRRLHSAVLHGKLPSTSNGYRGNPRRLYFSHAEPPTSASSDLELRNIEDCFAGLSISSGSEQLPGRKQDFAPWCGRGSASVSEDLCRIPSNTCSSSYVQFMPKSMTVPCSMASNSSTDSAFSAVVPPTTDCQKPSTASSSMGNVVVIECQCGGQPMTESVIFSTTDSSSASRSMVASPDDVYSSRNSFVRANSHPYAEPSAMVKSVSQPMTLNYRCQDQTSVPAVPGQEVAELRRSTSDVAKVRSEKPPQPPPPKVLPPRSSTTGFCEGLLPTPVIAGVEDFRIRRQVGWTNAKGHGSQHGPVKATVSFLKQQQFHNGVDSDRSMRPPPPPPPTRINSTGAGLSTAKSDSDSRRLTLQEVSAMVDRELRANEHLEDINSHIDESQQRQPTTQPTNRVLHHAPDSSRAVFSGASKPAAFQSKNDVDARLRSLGFDETIWNIPLEEILLGKRSGSDRKKKLQVGSVLKVKRLKVSFL